MRSSASSASLSVRLRTAVGTDMRATLCLSSFFQTAEHIDHSTDLSKLSELFVTARNSSLTYKGRAVDVKQVGVGGVHQTLSLLLCSTWAGTSAKAHSGQRVTQITIKGSGQHSGRVRRAKRDLTRFTRKSVMDPAEAKQMLQDIRQG